nr:virginiamycin b lyase [Quercus suber]
MYTSVVLAGLLLFAAPMIQSRPSKRQGEDSRFTFYSLKTPLAGPCDLIEGPDGALWGESILVNEIFRLDPDTGAFEGFTIPFTTPVSNVTLPDVLPALQDRTAFSCAIRMGGDGNLYAANGIRNQLIRINPMTKAIEIFEPTPVNPVGNLQPFNDLYSSSDGIYLTQTTGNVFQFFSFASETFTTYTVPTALALPLGVYVASDNMVYIAETLGNKILTFDPSTEAIEEYAIPIPAQLPAVIRAEKDGYVYFSLFTGNGIGRINMATHAIDIFPTNQTLGLGAGDTIDHDGGVWLSFFNIDALARLDTKTDEFSYVPFPDSFAADGFQGILGDVPPNVDVAVNYGPGNAIWFTSILRNQIGRYDLTGLYGYESVCSARNCINEFEQFRESRSGLLQFIAFSAKTQIFPRNDVPKGLDLGVLTGAVYELSPVLENSNLIASYIKLPKLWFRLLPIFHWKWSLPSLLLSTNNSNSIPIVRPWTSSITR